MIVCMVIVCIGSTFARDRKAEAEMAVVHLSSPDESIRGKALVALMDEDQINYLPESAFEPLLLMTKDNNKWNRVWAIQGLGRLGFKYLDKTAPIFIDALKDDFDVAASAAVVVGKFRLKEGTAQLAYLSTTGNLSVRHSAAEALSRIGNEEAKVAYIKYVKKNLPDLIKDFDSQKIEVAGDACTYISKMEEIRTFKQNILQKCQNLHEANVKDSIGY